MSNSQDEPNLFFHLLLVANIKPLELIIPKKGTTPLLLNNVSRLLKLAKEAPTLLWRKPHNWGSIPPNKPPGVPSELVKSSIGKEDNVFLRSSLNLHHSNFSNMSKKTHVLLWQFAEAKRRRPEREVLCTLGNI